MSEETLKIVVPVFTAVLGLFVGYFLNQALYERKRQDDLADRESNRRAEIYDNRIQEAQAYIDAYKEASLQLAFLESKLSMPSVIEETIAESFEQFDNMRKLTYFTSKRLHSINFLNDKELIELNNKLVTSYNNEVNNALQLREKILTHADVDKQAVRQRLSRFGAETSKILREMQQKLDVLSQKVP